MVACVDAQRETYGVESICAQLPIAPSTYWRHKAQESDPTRRSARAQRDDELKREITRVWHEQEAVYGAETVWRQLGREQIPAARCTVERLMKDLGLRGVIRGGAFVVTTRPDETAVVPDLVNRDFTATRPNQLWVAAFTYVATADGFVYTAFVIDVFARRIVGWKVSHAMRSDFVLDALDQALHQRGDDAAAGLVHHSDRGVQYVSMRYTERLLASPRRSAAAATPTTMRSLNQ
jgi:transposase InsO family protein